MSEAPEYFRGCDDATEKRLDHAYRAGKCPDSYPACGISPEETDSPYQRAECRACIGEQS